MEVKKKRRLDKWNYYCEWSEKIGQQVFKTDKKIVIKFRNLTYLKLVFVCPCLIPLIISWCVILNSFPENIKVAITAAFECVWITAPASTQKKRTGREKWTPKTVQ